MKNFIKPAAVAASLVGVAFATAVVIAPVAADSPGQLGGGAEVYQVKNLTQNGNYGSSISANACDELEYSIELHNTSYDAFSSVNVSVNLPGTSSTTNTSTATATTNLGGSTGTTGTATVNLSSAQTISYDTNTTPVLYDSQGNVIENLPASSLFGSGVNIGSLDGSTTEFVNFKAKVGCPTPATPSYTCNLFTVTADINRNVNVTAFNTTQTNGATFSNAVINWGDNTAPATSATPVGQTHQYGAAGTYTITATAHFNVNGQDVTASGPNCVQTVTFSTTNTPPTVTTNTPAATTTAAPTSLVNTGAGNVVGIFAAATAAGAVAYRWVLSRRLSRQ